MRRKAGIRRQAERQMKSSKKHIRATTQDVKDKVSDLGQRVEQAVPEPVREAMDGAVDQSAAVASTIKRSPRRRRIFSGVAGGVALLLVAINRRHK